MKSYVKKSLILFFLLTSLINIQSDARHKKYPLSNTAPPLFMTLIISAVTETSMDVTYRLDNVGTVYYLIVESGGVTPLSSSVITPENFSGSETLYASGSVTSTTTGVINITGLPPATSFDLHFVTEDALLNQMAVPTSILFVSTHSLPSITITTPNGGEKYEVDSVFNITWTTASVNGSDLMELRYINSVEAEVGGFTKLAEGSFSSFNGTFSWTVPNGEFDIGNLNFIQLVNVTTGIIDDTDAPFSIIAKADIERDFMNLVAIYDAMGGANWTDNAGWIDKDIANIASWTGVTLNGDQTRVEMLSLPSNNLVGGLPANIENLTALISIDLSGNSITALPLMTSLPALNSIDVSNNKLEFDDLELNINLTGFSYGSQANVGTQLEQDMSKGSDVTLNIVIRGQNNSYKWFLGDSELIGATQSTYVLTDINYDNMGVYRCEVNNSVVSTTISSNTQSYYATVNLQGRIYDNESIEVTAGEVKLLEIASTQFDTVAVTNLKNDGFGYLIRDVRLSDYLISVEGDLNKYLPSYYIDKVEWTKADTLFLRDHINNLDFNIESIPDLLTEVDGDGNTHGVVEEEVGDEGSGRMLRRRRVRGAGCSMRRRRAAGRGEDDFELIAYVKTNDNGEFNFDFLPSGEYKFGIEIPGVPVDTTSFISFTIGEGGVANNTIELAALVTADGIVVEKIVETGFYRHYFKNLNIYPNPAKNQLHIQYEKLLTKGVVVQLIDLVGSVLYEKTLEDGYAQSTLLDVDQIKEGMYILNFIDPNKRKLKIISNKIVIKR